MGGRAGSPKGLRASGKHSPCGGTGRARVWWRYRALGGQGGCERRLGESWGGGLPWLEQEDRDTVTHRAIKGEHAERSSAS